MIWQRSVCLLLAPTIVLFGCYESKIPIASSENSTINNALIGDWVASSRTGDDEWSDDYPMRLIIRGFNEKEYCIAFQGKNDREGGLARAYTVTIDGHDMAVFQSVGEHKFLFFEYSFENEERLVVQAVDDKLFEKRSFETQEGLRKFFAQHVGNEAFYMDPIHFVPSRNISMQLTIEETAKAARDK